MAELRLYQKDHEGFLKYVHEGISHCNADWQPRTFRDSLASALMDDDVNLAGLAGLEDGIALLDDAAKKLAPTVTTSSAQPPREAAKQLAALGSDEPILVPTTADPDEVDRVADILG